MKEFELKYNTVSNKELQNISGGVVPLIPVAVGFAKGFIYTAGAIITTRKLLSAE